MLATLAVAVSSRAALLWSDLGATQVHDTGMGADILGGILQRGDLSTDTLYFKFHVDPVSDASTELYFAAFQLFEGNQERLALGNALNAWAYSAFATGQTEPADPAVEYIDLNSSNPEPSGIGTFHIYELPHWGIERTIVFKVQYVAGGDDLVTVWLNPNLRPGATEDAQPPTLATRFRANASFDQIRLRHGGGGGGWIFSEMAIATAFSDFVPAEGSGAGGSSPFTFRSWQREQGLPENYVRTLAQTHDGYIWVGTDEGVSRFDGVSFFSLGPEEGFQGGAVQVLCAGTGGALWIGSVGGGLSCWQDGKLRKFRLGDASPSELITALAEDGTGRLWVGTQSGLVWWQNGALASVNAAEAFSGKRVSALFCDRNGTMWVGVAGAGVFSYHAGKFVQLRDARLNGLLQDPRSLLVDQQERIWIGAGDAVVLCLDAGRWRRFGMPRHLATHSISAFAEAPDGTVWAGSAGEGLFEFKSGRLVPVNASSGLQDNLIEALLVDREGKLWVGSHGGLNRVSLKKVSGLTHNEGLEYGAVHGLAEIRPGLVWAAQPNGVYQWDGRMFRRLRLSGLSPQEPSVSALLATRDGGCWMGGPRGLLHFRNPLNAEEEGGGEPALTNLSFSALAEGPSGGVWAGTRTGALWHLVEGQWQAETNCLQGHAITALAPEPEGGLWIGTDGDGLHRLDGRTRRIGRFAGLPSNWLRTLFLDRKGALWIGTAGGGLSRLQGGRVTTFTMREGLLDNTVSLILDDDDGNLWLGGDRGIVRVKKSDLDNLEAHIVPAFYPLIYGRTDGMPSEECMSGFFPAGLRMRDGLLWFPTLKGVAVIDPHQVVSSPAPAVTLEQVLVDGVPKLPLLVRGSDGANNRRGKSDAASELLRLSPGRHTLEFRYTGLSFDAPERVRFRYRLDRLDPEWVEAGTRHVAFYSFVPPGNYRFELIACNGDGIWNTAGASLALKVLPHFWQTWWFLGSAVVLTGIVVTGSGRMVEKRRLRQRLKTLEQERALERERTRIARDLHDTMGAKLCRISFISEHAQRRQAIPVELKEEIGSISDDSREVLRSLDEIVWAVNPQNDTLDHLVTYLGQYAQEYFRKTGVECVLEFPRQLPAQPLSSQTRHHLFLAVHEALTNILKHSQAKWAKITMACDDHELEIIVSDNGVGFSPGCSDTNSSSRADGFCNGLDNMHRRLTEIGGQCRVESKPDHGTIVRFTLSFHGQATVKANQ